MKRLRIVSFLIAFLAGFGRVAVPEPVSQLHPSNYVNDFAGVLDATTESQLNALAQQVEEKAKAQIAVVTVKSTDGEDIVSYSVDLYQKWGIGKKGTDRGVLILLAVQDRKYWTAVGYGLEPILPDGKVGGFGREAVPFLKSGDYAGAVSLMTSRVAQVIADDAGVTLEGVQRPVTREPANQPGAIGVVILIVLAGIFILVVWALSKAGGGGSSRGGGSGVMSGLMWGILLNSMSNRRGGWGGSSGGGWGGGGFGGGGGGGGFGGFGGGSTGGGGAGGSW